MNDVLAMLGSIFDFLESLFGRARVFSMLIGLGVGFCLTQIAKYPLSWQLLTVTALGPVRTRQEQQLRWSVRTVAVMTAAIATFFTWPNGNGLWVALATGGMCPVVYLVVIKAIGRWAPWLSVTRLPDDPPVL